MSEELEIAVEYTLNAFDCPHCHATTTTDTDFDSEEECDDCGARVKLQ